MNSPALKLQPTKEKYYCVPAVLEPSHIATLAKWISTPRPSSHLKRRMKLMPTLYKEPLIKQPFHKWSDLIDVKAIGKSTILCLKNTTRRILPRTCHLKYIHHAHYGTNGKILQKRIKSGDVVHRNHERTKQWVCIFFSLIICVITVRFRSKISIVRFKALKRGQKVSQYPNFMMTIILFKPNTTTF